MPQRVCHTQERGLWGFVRLIGGGRDVCRLSVKVKRKGVTRMTTMASQLV